MNERSSWGLGSVDKINDPNWMNILSLNGLDIVRGFLEGGNGFCPDSVSQIDLLISPRL